MRPLTEEKVLALLSMLYQLPGQVRQVRIISTSKAVLNSDFGTLLFKQHVTLVPGKTKELEHVYEKCISQGLCPPLMQPRQGGLFCIDHGTVLSLQPLLKKNDVAPNKSPARLGQALRMLHQAMSGILAKPLRNHFDRLLPSLAGPAKRYGLQDIVPMIKEVECRRASCKKLIHGDLHPGNVLLHNGKIMFLDLDSASSSALEVDIAFAAFRFFPTDRKAQSAFFHGYGLYEKHLDNIWKYLIYTIAQRILFILESSKNGDKRWEYDLAKQKHFLQEAIKRHNTCNETTTVFETVVQEAL